MKKILLIVFAAILCVSCDRDPSKVVYTSLATVISDSDEVLTFKTDKGSELEMVTNHLNYKVDKGQRAYIDFSIGDGDLGHYRTHLYYMTKILTKNTAVLDTTNSDTFGNDPIQLFDVWCSGGHLNVRFGINATGQVKHNVSVVENSLVGNPNDGKIYLEFRHNANQDGAAFGHSTMACFNLEKYKEGKKEQTFVVKFTEFNGVTTTKELKYDFSYEIEPEAQKRVDTELSIIE